MFSNMVPWPGRAYWGNRTHIQEEFKLEEHSNPTETENQAWLSVYGQLQPPETVRVLSVTK